jgi:hypothetical protein
MTIPKLQVSKPWSLIFQRLSGQKYSVQNCIPQKWEIYRLGFYIDDFGGCKWCFAVLCCFTRYYSILTVISSDGDKLTISYNKEALRFVVI